MYFYLTYNNRNNIGMKEMYNFDDYYRCDEEDMDSLNEVIKEDEQKSIYSSSVTEHQHATLNMIKWLVNGFVNDRLEIMKQCGIRQSKTFYEDIDVEISAIVLKSLATYFDRSDRG